RCSPGCSAGTQTSSRHCSNPAPQHGGRGCPGHSQRQRPCPATEGCPEEEPWGEWSPWGPCSVSCGGGEQLRRRDCPPPGGCPGLALQSKTCNTHVCRGECPDCAGLNCSWTPWGPWAECSHSCGVGVQQRLRAYSPPGTGGQWCPGILSAYVQRRFCNLQACKGGRGSPAPQGGAPAPWGLCLALAGHQPPWHLMGLMPTPLCVPPPVAVDGAWSAWSPWSRCDRTCGGGRAVRSRSCTPSRGQAGGGGDRGTRCPVTCHLAIPGPEQCTWGAWSPCSQTCGTGLATREGSCPCPTPGTPGAPCNDSAGAGGSPRRELEACY
uniref:SCO-spondin n=1 Tax=Anas platyrhynchos TaxID=8839 RepID=A0A8B9T856_ANAPL